MKTSISILAVSALVLTSCGTVRESRLNPFNWFGRSVSEPVEVAADVNPLIPRRSSIFEARQAPEFSGALVGEVSELLVERRPGGAIIRASGISDFQGAYELRLVKTDSPANVLAYDLRAYQPREARGGDLSRTISAAVWLTDNELAGISTIRVAGARNTRTARR